MENRTIEISLATAKEWYKGDNEVLKNLALQAYTEDELQIPTCVRSWEEFCEKYDKNDEYFIGTFSDSICSGVGIRDSKRDRNLLATKKDAEAFRALMQLVRLRDQWWETLDWEPDYTDYKYKYFISAETNKLNVACTIRYNRILIFPTKEVAEDFLNCFRDLIEKAKKYV